MINDNEKLSTKILTDLYNNYNYYHNLGENKPYTSTFTKKNYIKTMHFSGNFRFQLYQEEILIKLLDVIDELNERIYQLEKK